MNIAFFCHSLLSDWNHGNAHFLRGLVSELSRRGHRVKCFEAEDAWSARNLTREFGAFPLEEVRRAYPALDVVRYQRERFDVERVLDGIDLALVHEWNDPELVFALGHERRQAGARFKLLFHDTHHRAVSDADAFGRLDLSCYDGVLAFGAALADRYRAAGWGRRVWTFHEAADAAVFRPLPEIGRERDLVWIGNWGDEERTAELQRFLLEPARSLGVRGSVYGVRYPASGLEAVAAAGLEYGGWLANYRVPEVFAKHRVTVHVPRRPYERELTGIPTIRVFEALACGIPLICAPWTDSEELFRAGDYLGVNDGEEMRRALRLVLQDTAAADELARRGRETVLAKHTCIQRVDELLGIWEQLQTSSSTTGRAASAEVSAWD